MIIVKVLARFLTSRIGLAALLCSALWGWHVFDKQNAVATAREGFVRQFELAAARAEIDAVRRRVKAAALANETLQNLAAQAEGEASRFAAELEAYANETKINPDCRAGAALIGRLRAN